jgi:hypothetical protein
MEVQVENCPTHEPDQYDWHNALQEALLEVNPGRLREKVTKAEEVLSLRLQALRPSDTEERRALHDACDLLWSIKRETLKVPDWKTQQGRPSDAP